MYQPSITILRALKGAPVSIYLAMMIEQRPVSATWLEMVTGYGNRETLKGLRLLVEYKLVMRLGYSAWQVANAEQGILELRTNDQLCSSDIVAAATATTRLEGTNNHEGKTAVVEDQLCRSDIVEQLFDAGIGEPMATRISKLDHVTEEYLAAHIREATRQKISTGLLIHRILSRDRAPETDEEKDRRHFREIYRKQND